MEPGSFGDQAGQTGEEKKKIAEDDKCMPKTLVSHSFKII